MKKAIVLLIGILLVGLMVSPTIKGDETEKKDVHIDPNDFTDDLLWSSKGDKVRIQVDSDIPVDVYVINSDDFNMFDLSLSNLSRASLTEKDITSLDTNWTQPDDRNYYLVIHNDNDQQTAVVDYSYTDVLGSEAEEAGEAIGMFCLSVLIIGIIVVVLIIVVIILLVKKNNKQDTQQKQQYPAPQQQRTPPQPPKSEPKGEEQPPPPPPQSGTNNKSNTED